MPEEYQERTLPDQVTMGLLPYLTANALDKDYAVAARRAHPGEGQHQRRPIGTYGAAALALFAVLGVTAAAQTSRNSATDERERQDLVQQIDARQKDLDESRKEVRTLKAAANTLERRLLEGDDASRGVLNRLTLLGLRSGTTPVTGPGVRVVVDDAPGAEEDERRKVLDTDLQQLVNGLWQAGAEAIAVNRQRLTNLSAIRHAGDAITVNFRSLSRPYTVEAIGDPGRLPTRFGETTSGQTWLDLQRTIGLSFNMVVDRTLRLPGNEPRELRFAKAPNEPERRNP